MTPRQPRRRTATAMQFADISRHPLRALVFAVIGFALTWLIVAKSLSYAIAETSPEFALWLNPRQPVALLLLAERARAKLLKLTFVDGEVTASIDNTPEEPVGDAQVNPSNALRLERLTAAEERKTLRGEMRSLASRVIASERLEARAFRLLAEGTSTLTELRPLMQAAVQRSRREANAVFWLMNDSFERNDLLDASGKADILLRTRPQLLPYVSNYLAEMAATSEGRALLIPLLAANPNWRTAFLNALPGKMPSTEAPLEVMLALKAAGSPPSAKELASYLEFLVSKKQPEFAYSAWLQFIPQGKLASLGLLNNARFAEQPSGLPFDWSFRRGQNTSVDFVPLRDDGSGRALRFSFGIGRVRFPEISQVLLLAPGRYRLTGSFQGMLTAKRGLRWELRCIEGKRSLGETEMIHGAVIGWQAFALEVQLRDDEDCRAQRLRLYHDARSPSEELISGEILFRGLQLVRYQSPT